MVKFDLLLPRNISPNHHFYGVWIKNGGLGAIGLKRGGFALAVRTKLNQGDLAAFLLVESDLIVIGFYSEFAGIISLENCNFEIEIYNRNEVEFFGKIIGYGNKPKSESMPIDIVEIHFQAKG